MRKLEFRISEIAYDGFSGIIQQTLVLQLLGLLELLRCAYIICIVMSLMSVLATHGQG